MKKIIAMALATTFFLQPSFSYEIKSKANSSYITIHETTEGNYSLQYCKLDADHCIYLGPKSAYSFEELTHLKKSEQIKGTALAVTSIAIISFGAWIGSIGGGLLGMKYYYTASGINAVIGIGKTTGAIISATGVSLMDRVNPLKRFQTAKTISKINSDEVDYKANVDSYAMWLNSQLFKIK